MIEATHWHPVSLVDASEQQPMAVTSLTREWVLWLDDSDEARNFGLEMLRWDGFWGLSGRSTLAKYVEY